MSGELIVDTIRPDNVDNKVTIDGNLDVSGQKVSNYQGFPEPDYDSGWQSSPGNGQSTNLIHNLGTRDFKHVAVTGATEAAGTNPFWAVGVTSSGTGQYGFSVNTISDDIVSIYVYPNGGMHNVSSTASYFRVKIWK